MIAMRLQEGADEFDEPSPPPYASNEPDPVGEILNLLTRINLGENIAMNVRSICPQFERLLGLGAPITAGVRDDICDELARAEMHIGPAFEFFGVDIVHDGLRSFAFLAVQAAKPAHKRCSAFLKADALMNVYALRCATKARMAVDTRDYLRERRKAELQAEITEIDRLAA